MGWNHVGWQLLFAVLGLLVLVLAVIWLSIAFFISAASWFAVAVALRVEAIEDAIRQRRRRSATTASRQGAGQRYNIPSD